MREQKSIKSTVLDSVNCQLDTAESQLKKEFSQLRDQTSLWANLWGIVLALIVIDPAHGQWRDPLSVQLWAI